MCCGDDNNIAMADGTMKSLSKKEKCAVVSFDQRHSSTILSMSLKFFFFLFLTMSCLCERCACARAHFYGYELRCVVFTWDQIRMHINSGNMSKYRTAEDLLSHSEWCGGYWRREWDPTTSRKKNSTLIHAIVWNYISIGWTENIGMTCQFGERNTHTTRARFS